MAEYFEVVLFENGVKTTEENLELINNIETTIRFYVNEAGEICSIDAFIGYSERAVGNLIK